MREPRQFPLRFTTGWHCDECQREGEALIAQFREAVARGEYDHAGYTPAERKAQRQRGRA